MAQVLRHAPPVALDRAREYAGGVARVDSGRSRVEPLRAHQPLHVLQVFQPETGGVPAYVVALSAGLIEAGVRVSAAGPPGAPALAQLRALGIDTLALELAHHPHPVRDALAVRALARWCKQRQVSLIHGHSTKAGMLAALAGRRAGRPSLYTPNGWSFEQHVSPPLRAAYVAWERYFARHLHAAIVCVSASGARAAQRWGAVPAGGVEVVRTGLPSAQRPARMAARRRLGLGPEAVVAVWVGRSGRQKRPEDLAPLARRLRGQVTVLAFCHGAHGTPLEADLQSAGVVLAPAGTDPGLGYAAADLMVQTSAWEGTPLAVLEAMDAGLPVVAYEVGGVSDQVRPGRTGFLVAPGDLDMLTDCVGALARRPDLRERMADAGRAHARNRFSYAEMIDGMLGAYRRCAASRPRPSAVGAGATIARARTTGW